MQSKCNGMSTQVILYNPHKGCLTRKRDTWYNNYSRFQSRCLEADGCDHPAHCRDSRNALKHSNFRSHAMATRTTSYSATGNQWYICNCKKLSGPGLESDRWQHATRTSAHNGSLLLHTLSTNRPRLVVRSKLHLVLSSLRFIPTANVFLITPTWTPMRRPPINILPLNARTLRRGAVIRPRRGRDRLNTIYGSSFSEKLSAEKIGMSSIAGVDCGAALNRSSLPRVLASTQGTLLCSQTLCRYRSQFFPSYTECFNDRVRAACLEPLHSDISWTCTVSNAR